MSKRMNTKDLKLGELSTINEYLKWLEENKGVATTKQAIHYQLIKTDNLDWCDWQGNKLIVMNEKAKSYTPKEARRG